MIEIGEHHLARPAARANERRGDYPSLLYEGGWLSSGEIFQRTRRLGGVHGEEVVAFVSLHDGSETDTEQLIDWARERIGGYKYPREIHIVDAIPLTPVGKIDRNALRLRHDR